MEITNRAFRKAMDAAGLGKVQLWKDNGYFFIYSDDKETSRLIMELESQGIYGINSFNQLTVEGWVSEIRNMMDEAERLAQGEQAWSEDEPLVIRELSQEEWDAISEERDRKEEERA